MGLFNFRRPKKKAAAATSPPLPPTQVSSLKQSLLSLEQRLMFDAAAAATAAEVASEHVAQEQADAAVSTETSHETTSTETAESQDVLKALATFMPAEARTEVVFVDPTVPNYQELLAGMAPNTEVIMLDAERDGVQQIADSLSGRTGIDAIHLISHGNAGELQLGTSHLTQESMTGHYASELAVIKGSLSDQADLLIYGCNFAEGEQGERATTTLADLTGTDVEASVDLTGSVARGGDWDLEFKVGQIETSLAIGQLAQENWANVLHEDADGDHDEGEGDESNDHEDDDHDEDDDDVHNNSAPILRSDGGGEKAAISVAENTTIVTTVRATDSEGQPLTYTITGGDDAAKFSINSSTGELSFVSAQNYEAPTDRGGNHVYDVKVQASDGHGGKDTQSLKVTVTDVNEAPLALSLSTNTVAENATNGTVVGTVTATDVDAGDTKSYRLTDTAGGRFAINASTGVLTVADGSLLNYERTPSHTVTVRVTDSGGLTYDEAFTINLTNVNEGLTDLALMGHTVAENAAHGTVVGTASTTDPDAGDMHTYQLTNNAGGRFAINSATGQVTVADGSLLNYERATSHSITVRTTDAGGLTHDQTFIIALTDVNETPTDLSLSANQVAEQAANGTVVGTVTGTDVDTGDTRTYRLTDTAGGRFAINASTGVITVANSSLLNYESAPSHTVTVRVTDSGGRIHEQRFTISRPSGSLAGSLVQPPTNTHHGANPFVLAVTSKEHREEFRPPEDVRKAGVISSAPASVVRALSQDRTLHQSVPLEYFDGSSQASEAKMAVEHSAAQSGVESGAQGRATSGVTPIAGRIHGELQESEHRLILKDKPGEADVVTAAEMAAVVRRSGLRTSEKATIPRSRIRGNAPLSSAGHAEELESVKPDGDGQTYHNSSKSEESRPS